MERSKLVAIITGAISLILAIAYLILVQILDFRGEMLPAPVSQIPQGVEVSHIHADFVGAGKPDALPSASQQHNLGLSIDAEFFPMTS